MDHRVVGQRRGGSALASQEQDRPQDVRPGDVLAGSNQEREAPMVVEPRENRDIAAVSEREAGEARPPLSFGSSAAKRAEELGSRLCGCVVRRDPYRAGDGPVGVNPSCPCGG